MASFLAAGQVRAPSRRRSAAEQVPSIVHQVLRSPGSALDGAMRRELEGRFAVDFSSVRVHHDPAATESARAVRARAYTAGRHVVFGAGEYNTRTSRGLRLLTHEMAHVAQHRGAMALPREMSTPRDAAERAAERTIADGAARTAAFDAQGNPRLLRTPQDPTEQAHYPTPTERGGVREILDPQQTAAQAAGGTVPAVSNPAGFRQDMRQRMNEYINAALPNAQARQTSPVSIGMPVVSALGDVAQREVESYFRAYLAAAVHTPQERQRRANLQLRSHLHLVSERASDATVIACNWVSSRMQDRGSDLIRDYNVLANVDLAKRHCSAGSATGGAQPINARDQALFESVRDEIMTARGNDVRTIVMFQSSFHGGGETFIQSQMAARGGESTQDTMRRGRWESFGTIVHEMLHAVVHERFAEAASRLEGTNIAVEGFAEHFARAVYDNVRSRAQNDAALRALIEGVQAPYDPSLAPPMRGYQQYVDAVVAIRSALRSNEASLRVAYFMGRLEYLGLSGWTEAEAARQEARRHPANQIGFAAILTEDSAGFFRIDYRRVLAGRGGAWQFQLGGTVNYLTPGDRLGLGGTLSLQYQGANVYVRGGVAVGASTSLRQPFTDSVRLDLIPGAELGVRIGVVRIGAGATMLFPVAGGPVNERVLRLGGSAGVSVDF